MGWLRVIARKEAKRVRLYSRPGNDLTDRSPLMVEALASDRKRIKPKQTLRQDFDNF